MEIEGKGENQQQQGQGQNENKGKRKIIEIPSYEQVVQNSQPKSTPLFTSTPSFSQAFSFIKNSEFYTPPPQPPPFTSSQEIRHSDRLEAPTSSASSAQVHASSSSLNSVQTRNSVLVSHRQKGNPLLKHIRNVRWNVADIVCDYLLGQSTCALYLSLRYHLLHPDYLYYRIRELQKNYKLRIVLCHVDVEDVAKPLLEVTRTAMLHDCTLLCGWSLEECGRYLETIKVYENKPADLIQGQMDTDYISRLSHCLTAIRHVNKTDVVTLGSTFGSLSHIMDASMEDLAHCPGIGERKVKRLYDTFHEPFKRVVPSRPPATESSVQNCAKSPVDDEVPEVVKEEGNSSKRTKKEPEMTVTSALSAAFARYSSKIGKKNDKSLGEKNEGSIADEEVNAERI